LLLAPSNTYAGNEVVEIATEEIITEAPATQEPLQLKNLFPQKNNRHTYEISIACVTLLTQSTVWNPPVGKVTFSWTPMDEAEKYVLNIIFHRVMLYLLKQINIP